MLAIALCVRLTSPGPALFTQKRVGKGGRLFSIYKFRSMTADSSHISGPGLTSSEDSRITRVGKLMRALKIDELPQLFNILRGDMSLIGPRPKLPKYEATRTVPFRPGVTGAATLAFRDEEEILRSVAPAELDDFYDLNIKHVKASLDERYMRGATFWTDMSLLADTLYACVSPSRVPPAIASLPRDEQAWRAAVQGKESVERVQTN
jgi:lipopolysaccharide/colanic/teichoic acid biosynthesis glycosyltransferase